MNKCRIYDENSRSRTTHYKNVDLMKDKKFGVLNRIKSYSTIVNQSNHSYKSQKTTTNQPTSGDSVENKGTLKEIVLVLRRR